MSRECFADCWFLTGPTAAGKTAVGIALAQRLGAEILSLDSMAVYRGMDVGTAKPTADERRAVPHHLLDLREPHEDYSVAQYLDAAGAIVRDLRARNMPALFVGGTPLYLKALLRGLFDGPPADWPLRHALMEKAQRFGPEALHAELSTVDPAAAARLHPADTRRVIRALEVFRLTGRPISSWQQEFAIARSAEDCRVFVLDWPRDELDQRISLRVQQMFAAGLVDEVRRLLESPLGLGRTARQALGYREVLEHLAGRASIEQTMELVVTRTRQFARRQLTWFRSLAESRWMPVVAGETPDECAARIAELGS